jgi:hypothetical protein
MNRLPLTIIAALCLGSTLAGCLSQRATFIEPRVPISGRSDAVTTSDSRTVTVPKALTAQVEAKRYVGQSHFQIIALRNDSVADLVGSVVAAQMPDARVDVREFILSVEYGMWLATATTRITAEIARPQRPPFVVRASGFNDYSIPTPENFSLSVERALNDFAEKLKGVPAN